MFWCPVQIYIKRSSFYEELARCYVCMYVGLRVKYQLFLSNFNDTCIICRNFRKALKYQISWKSVQYEPSRFIIRREGKTVSFLNFANAPKTLPVSCKQLQQNKAVASAPSIRTCGAWRHSHAHYKPLHVWNWVACLMPPPLSVLGKECEVSVVWA